MATDKKTEMLQQLQNEKSSIDPAYVNAVKLLNEEIERVQTGRDTGKFVEIHHGKPMKLAVKILIPIKQFPKFNFVGKLLGPNGNSLKRLQAETLTKMAILGRGSMRDKNKEEELRKEGGKYSHLNQELHVCVEAFATPVECHQRIAHALSELQMFLSPDTNDDIRSQQLEEMMYLNGDKPGPSGGPGGPGGPPSGPPRGRGRGRGAAPPPPSRGGRGGLTPSALLATPGMRNPAPPARPQRGLGRAMPPPSRGAPSAGRGGMAPRPAPSRPAPRPSAMETSYDQDPYYQQQASSGFGDDGYGAYEETDYSEGYQQPAQETEYYDYGHGATADDGYGGDYGDGWNQPSTGYGKAPTQRPRSGLSDRSHPYGGNAGSRAPRF